MAVCKLCGKRPASAKSHIIPKSLYGDTIGHPSGHARLHTSNPSERVKRSPVGEYDCNLLCPDCEDSFDPYDDYAAKLFMQQQPSAEIWDKGKTIAYRYDGVDIDLLRAFFLSLIWRMHATDRPMFKSVDVGSYEPAIRSAVLSRNSSAVPEFDVALTRFDNKEMGLLGPTRLRLKGVNGYRFNFQGFSVWAKLDKRKIPTDFDEVVLSTGEPLHMLGMDFEESAEFRAMKKVIRTRRN